jgi:hypothetical protein
LVTEHGYRLVNKTPFEDGAMDKRNDNESTGEPAVNSGGAPEQTLPKSELPSVESPSISPAIDTPAIAAETPAAAIEPIAAVEPAIAPAAAAAAAASVIEPVAAPEPVIEPILTAARASAAESQAALAPAPRFAIKARHKRNALLAASVAVAAALGAIVGAVASGGFSTPLPRTDVASVEERKAMEKSIAHLSREITTLKASIEAANKSAHTQIAKIGERFDRVAQKETTGSIATPASALAPAPPQTTATTQTTATPLQSLTPPAPAAAPIPTPRPAPRIAAVESQPPPQPLPLPQARPPVVVSGWSIYDTRDGYVYVEGHGDVYRVTPGVPLPGVGTVESVKRQDGRWVVLTPKGIIVSMRDRRYFESF